MPIPSLDAIEGVPKSRAKKGRAKATYLRYDPDTGEKVRVTRDDDRYDEWLTATQYRKQKKDEAEDDEGDFSSTGKKFATDVAKDILKDLKKPTRGNRRLKANVTKAVKGTTGAKSVITRVAPIAARLAGVAAVIGATWWAVSTLKARAVRKEVEAEIARGEARLGRAYTARELEALLPQYKAWFSDQQKKDQVRRLSNL